MTAGVCVLPHRYQPERERHTVPGLLVCRGDFLDLQRCLIGEDRFNSATRVRTRSPGLAELYLDLERVLSAGGRGVSYEPRSASYDHPLPLVPVVSDHRRDIAEILGSWVTQHMAEWPETGPGTIDPAVTTRWLALRLDKAVTQDRWVKDYAAELRALRGRAFALLDPVRTSRYPVAWCVTPGCGQALVADIVRNDELLPPLIYCSGECGAEWPPHRWIELGRAVRKAQEQQAQRNGAA